MDYNWKKLSKIELEKNYNPREAVANFSTYIEEYKNINRRSARREGRGERVPLAEEGARPHERVRA